MIGDCHAKAPADNNTPANQCEAEPTQVEERGVAPGTLLGAYNEPLSHSGFGITVAIPHLRRVVEDDRLLMS